ncbi:hypothetical protein BJV82DRAFT_675607 [Fennellomyces sp. T-0311]|nr:hypothetical protein BJV82DRAFT_675607 [Fennellomyces sp. T-0311]
MNVQEPTENVDAFIDLAFPERHHRVCSRVAALHRSLNEDYRYLEDILKQIAKIHTTLKHDAFNILNLHLHRFLENEEAFAATPDFTNQTLYAKAYILTSVVPFHDVPRGEAGDPWVEDLRDTFATFQDCRSGPQRQDVKEHMTQNLPKYLKNVCTKYADMLRQVNNNENLLQGLTSGKITSLISTSLFRHDAQPPAEFANIVDLQDAYMKA